MGFKFTFLLITAAVIAAALPSPSEDDQCSPHDEEDGYGNCESNELCVVDDIGDYRCQEVEERKVRSPTAEGRPNKSPRGRIVYKRTPEMEGRPNKSPRGRVVYKRSPEMEGRPNKSPRGRVVYKRSPEMEGRPNKSPRGRIVYKRSPRPIQLPESFSYETTKVVHGKPRFHL